MHNGGYVKAYPKYFDPAWHANGKTSNLTRAMDLARYYYIFSAYFNTYGDLEIKDLPFFRGGRTQKVFKPRTLYPANAWYTYDDTTCNYPCQAIEYLWWGYLSYSGNSEFQTLSQRPIGSRCHFGFRQRSWSCWGKTIQRIQVHEKG